MNRMLRTAKAELASRGIGTTDKSALEVFALRATDRREQRERSKARKANRARRHD
jgi:hypothetical protein